MRTIATLLLSLTLGIASAQNGTLSGSAKDKLTQEPLIGATIQIESAQLGAATDVDGNFRISNITPGSYNITVSYVGYATQTRYNVVITSGNASFLNFELEPAAASELGEVVISENRSVKIASIETPVSIKNLSTEEIKVTEILF